MQLRISFHYYGIQIILAHFRTVLCNNLNLIALIYISWLTWACPNYLEPICVKQQILEYLDLLAVLNQILVFFFRLIAFYETIYLFTNRGQQLCKLNSQRCVIELVCNTYFWAWLHFCLNKRLFLHFGTNCSYIIFFCLIFLLRQDMYHHHNPPHPPLLCDIIIYIFIEKGLFPTYCYVDLYVVVCLNCLLITISRL